MPTATTLITLDQVLTVADEAYGDELIRRYADGEEAGDTLAQFLAIEIRETYDAESPGCTPYDVAAYYVENAIDNLRRVHRALIQAGGEAS